MAKKKKEKVKLFEAVQFEDLEHAKRTVTLAKINQLRILIGLAFAAISTGYTIYGLLGNPADSSWMGFAMILAFPAYLIGGGIGKALKAAWNITKIGWFLIPVFPADLLLAIGFFFISLILFLFIPIVFVGLNFIQHKKTLDNAKSYLAQCGYAMTAEVEE